MSGTTVHKKLDTNSLVGVTDTAGNAVGGKCHCNSAVGVAKLLITFQVSVRRFLASLRVWATLPRALEIRSKIPPVLLAVLLGAPQTRAMTLLAARNRPGTTLLGCKL